MDEVSRSEEYSQLRKQVRKQATERETFPIRACWELSLYCSYANN